MGEENLDFLRYSPLFSGFTEDQFEALISLAEVQGYEPGEVIVEEGSPGDRLFILMEGAIDIEKGTSERTSRTLATLQERGDFFGEMAVVDILPRSATARAREQSQVVVFTKRALVELFDSHPEALTLVALNIARVLSQRLRRTDEDLAALSG